MKRSLKIPAKINIKKSTQDKSLGEPTDDRLLLSIKLNNYLNQRDSKGISSPPGSYPVNSSDRSVSEADSNQENLNYKFRTVKEPGSLYHFNQKGVRPKSNIFFNIKVKKP